MGAKKIRLRFRIIFFVLTCLAILIADLTIALINKYILSYKGSAGLHYITIAGMAGVLTIFYLFVKYINRVSENFVDRFVHITRVYLGREIGLYLSVSLLLILIYAGYYWTWFDRNLFTEMWKAILSVISQLGSLISP